MQHEMIAQLSLLYFVMVCVTVSAIGDAPLTINGLVFVLITGPLIILIAPIAAIVKCRDMIKRVWIDFAKPRPNQRRDP